MKNLIEYILIHIVENPEDVKIETEPNEQGTTYIITVNPDDMGRVIGKKGSIIQSIRAIARVRAIKEGERAHIIVADPAEETAPNVEATSTVETATDAVVEEEVQPEQEKEESALIADVESVTEKTDTPEITKEAPEVETPTE
jgi:uncharacterized protein